MRYLVRVNGEEHEVLLDERGVHIDGSDVVAQVLPIDGTPERMVTIGSAVHRVVVRQASINGATPASARGRYTLWLDGHRFDVEALDERTHAIRELAGKSAGPSGPAPVIAPMPGLIVRVNAQVGDEVHAGQGIVVMEAMKMENELRAPAAGRVKTVLAVAGTAVEKGTVLVEFEN
ncbi:MAG TPA: acetyl-CoA carboxylase biotin carboxyl carrier protein subunit [Gemmatimonadaceae bacterium]|jgi:pyruvate carboxylase subunit B|nr:acetyl-CoA carboxylase biotin carboxyl carrier protein subunit [Gemmatimonadaceae bacterium]